MAEPDRPGHHHHARRVAGIWVSYRLANPRKRNEFSVIDPEVEKQYTTDPPEQVANRPIDVTPTHLREERRD